ncbi:DUF6157 family protein [Salmonirosea aquatica]|uniref:Uncharacterized protein n=1 Tax=Salmonirosea aquatica TaxID=2654236 RepID=A0A7C9BCZ9_9BACT|nr:hypothetical protein [Cytophagaceae bacterium SJW1-29]
MHSTNYYDTFIEVADDCPTEVPEVPLAKGDKPTSATRQFEMIGRNPYRFTSDEVLFAVYAEKHDLAESEKEEARSDFFSKGQPCLRASPLPKRYGWGVHSNSEGKIALFAVDSREYEILVKDPSLKHVKAMRSQRT